VRKRRKNGILDRFAGFARRLDTKGLFVGQPGVRTRGRLRIGGEQGAAAEDRQEGDESPSVMRKSHTLSGDPIQTDGLAILGHGSN
jgi:hypothetical protein